MRRCVLYSFIMGCMTCFAMLTLFARLEARADNPPPKQCWMCCSYVIPIENNGVKCSGASRMGTWWNNPVTDVVECRERAWWKVGGQCVLKQCKTLVGPPSSCGCDPEVGPFDEGCVAADP